MKSDKQIKEIVDKANLLLNEKDYKGALPLFEELSEIFIDNFHTLYNISLCYFNLENFKKTRDLLDDMDKKFPLNTQINFLKGFCYEKGNDFVKANEFYKKDQEEISKKIKELGLENNLISHEGLTPGMLVTLGEQKILTLNDFADLASDELTGSYDIVKGERVKIRGYLEDFALSKKEADDLIMSAREKVYKD